MFPITRNDRELFAVFPQRIKLIREGCLELLASDVRELGLSDEGFSFGTDKFLFEDDNLWGTGRLDIPNALDGDTILVVAVDKLVLQLANLIDQNTQFVRNVRDIVIALLAPDR
ncbi:hypothetical protein GP486_002652 [Trichoglossum hirsutum]|uniref:Uncharacterized protein n=1 Tax=Trichoglossum hirsutum TaxID=265104 RepID=A0A9P8LET8_9PEZI|nr:hypothetical protein GP486_002652 [Trichoglossum hirsutum]